MLLVQIALYCLLYALFVKCAAKGSGLNCLYFSQGIHRRGSEARPCR